MNNLPFITAACFIAIAVFCQVHLVKLKAPDNIQCRLFVIYLLLIGILSVLGTGLSLIILRLDWLIALTP